MKLSPNRECNDCEACGEEGCWGTQKECDAYHEIYGTEETNAVKQFADGPANVELMPTEEELFEYLTEVADGPAVVADLKSHMNTGIINRLTGRVVNVIQGDIMAHLTIQIGPDTYISSMMPIEKFLGNRKNTGDLVTAVFKAVNVSIMR